MVQSEPRYSLNVNRTWLISDLVFVYYLRVGFGFGGKNDRTFSNQSEHISNVARAIFIEINTNGTGWISDLIHYNTLIGKQTYWKLQDRELIGLDC